MTEQKQSYIHQVFKDLTREAFAQVPNLVSVAALIHMQYLVLNDGASADEVRDILAQRKMDVVLPSTPEADEFNAWYKAGGFGVKLTFAREKPKLNLSERAKKLLEAPRAVGSRDDVVQASDSDARS